MRNFLIALLICLPLVSVSVAEPSGKVAALLADLNTKQLANIPPSVAEITVTPGQAEAYEPITATLDADIPADSRVYGNGWSYSAGVRTLPVSATVQHVWAPPGKHTVGYAGVWVHTRTIIIVDKQGNDQTIESLLGIGMIDSSASFTVGGEGPDPPPPPPPPPLPPLSDLKVVILLESDNQRAGLEGVYLFQHLQAVTKYLSSCEVWWTTMDNSEPLWKDYAVYVPTGVVLPCLVFVDDRDKSVVTAKAFGVSEYATINTLKGLGVK